MLAWEALALWRAADDHVSLLETPPAWQRSGSPWDLEHLGGLVAPGDPVNPERANKPGMSTTYMNTAHYPRAAGDELGAPPTAIYNRHPRDQG